MIRADKKTLLSITSVVILLTIWKISALIVDAEVILPSPEKVLNSIKDIVTEKNFNKRLVSTILRGFLGFFISLSSGVIIGILAGVFPLFRRVIAPVISIIRSTPVIAVILLALIWFNINYVPVFVAFLMAFPIICGNIIEGITTVDPKLLEMAKAYNISLNKQIMHIYIPSILPFIVAAASLSLGVIWKVIVAAEVLSQPKWGIGTSLNEAKAFLITEEVFAWTIIAISLNAISEYLFNKISNKMHRRSNGH